MIVYAVSIEDDSCGMVDWYPDLEEAEKVYLEAIANPGWADQEVNLFPCEVEDGANDDAITQEVDDTMWQRDYDPLRWRKGTAHSAQPHKRSPTD